MAFEKVIFVVPSLPGVFAARENEAKELSRHALDLNNRALEANYSLHQACRDHASKLLKEAMIVIKKRSLKRAKRSFLLILFLAIFAYENRVSLKLWLKKTPLYNVVECYRAIRCL